LNSLFFPYPAIVGIVIVFYQQIVSFKNAIIYLIDNISVKLRSHYQHTVYHETDLKCWLI